MDERTVGQVEEWDSRPFEGGYDGLHSLADEGFTGAVTAAGAWLFMLNGRIIGVFNGRLDDFDGGGGTTYQAPHPSLPLLFSMLEQGGETQAQYFTDDNSIDEVDETLKEANFTGYLELSENVLSGDYYVVYYGGRSLSAAFVGNAEQLITGNEAFQRTVDEVGIYEVIDVDLNIHELPEPSTPTAAASDGDETTDIDSDSADSPAEPATAADPPVSESKPVSEDTDPGSTTSSGTAGSPASASTSDADLASNEPIEEAEPDTPPDSDQTTTPDARSSEQPTDSADDTAASSDHETAQPTADQPTVDSDSDSDPDPQPGQQSTPQPDTATPASEGSRSESPEPSTSERTPADQADSPDQPGQAASTDRSRQSTDSAASTDADADSPFSEEEEWRETRDVPALDPSESEPTADQSTETETTQPSQPSQPDSSDARPDQTQTSSREEPPQGDRTGEGTQSQPQQSHQSTQPQTQQSTSSQASEDSGPIRADNAEKLRTLRSQLEERSAELESVREELAATKEERDQLQDERDRLKQRIQTLEAELEEARERAPANDEPAATDMDPEDALSQTDIFIRYGSKGNATLEKAHEGTAKKEEVTANLKLEHHTRFDGEQVTVDGEPFDAFLQSTMEYQFTKWVVEDLLFELQETGSSGKLQDLYDVLPRFDRSELRGTVELRNENGEEIHEAFDIVVRDRMGQPLIVVNMNNSRDPATSEMMEDLIESANNVKFANDSLGAAVEVTASFFQPDALETASEATGSGLLSRDRRASFIKLNRKQGYHLCLVEARNGAFHVNVPEL